MSAPRRARFTGVARWVPPIVAAVALLLAPVSARAVVNPVLAGSVSDSTVLPGIDSVAVAGNYAYVTDYYAGRVTAIDISTPSMPLVAGSSASSSALMNGATVNIADGYAFVVSKNRNGPEGSGSNDNGSGNSMTILDIHTDPAIPTIVSEVHDANTLFGAYGIAVSGNYAYVAAQGCITLGHLQPCPDESVGNDLDVIEISNPIAPKIVATLRSKTEPEAFSHVTAVAISGNYAYLTAAYTDRLTVVDIANPLEPKVVASLHDPTHFTFPVDVAVSGNYAYVINQKSNGPFATVDISNPQEPKVVGFLASSALAGGYRIRVRGTMAYIAASESPGVAVVDISNPLSPQLLASYSDEAHLHSITGLDLDAAGSHVIATSANLSTQHLLHPAYPPYALEPEGPELTGTVSVITLAPESIETKPPTESKPGNSTTQTSGGHEAPPSTAQIQAALMSALLPGGKAGRIASINKRHGYQVTFNAPAGGAIAISWYELPKGARLARAKPVLVASVRATIKAKGAVKLTLKLTARGKSLLKHAHRIKLTGRGVFTLAGGSPVTVTKTFTLR